jgi:hypothetical protein
MSKRVTLVSGRSPIIPAGPMSVRQPHVPKSDSSKGGGEKTRIANESVLDSLPGLPGFSIQDTYFVDAKSRKSSGQNGRRDNRMPARAPGQSCQWEASVVAAFAGGITRLATTKETHFRSQTQVRLASGYAEHAMEVRVN